MDSLSEQHIVRAIQEVKQDVAAGKIEVGGIGAIRKNSFVCEVCGRLGVAYAEIGSRVYEVLRLLEGGNGRLQ